MLAPSCPFPKQGPVTREGREALPNTCVCLIAESSATSAVPDMRRSQERRAVLQVNKPCLVAQMEERREGERSTHVRGSSLNGGPENGGWKQQVSHTVLPVQDDLLNTLGEQTPVLTCLCPPPQAQAPAFVVPGCKRF